MSARTPTSRIGSSRDWRRLHRRVFSTYAPRQQFSKLPSVPEPEKSAVADVKASNIGDMVPTSTDSAPVIRPRTTAHPFRNTEVSFSAPPEPSVPGTTYNFRPFRESESTSTTLNSSTIGLPKINFTHASFSGPVKNAFEINEFLNKYPPSKTRAEEVGQWIWVTKDKERHGLPTTAWQNRAAIARGRHILRQEHEATKKARESAPKDQWSMSILDETLLNIREPMKEIAGEHGYTAGGWFCTLSGDYADELFRALARNLISGPLKDTPVTAIKVSPITSIGKNLHILVVLQKNIYNKMEVRQVLEMLIKLHGWLPTGAKPDLYHQIGIGHMHRSRGNGSLYLPFDFFSREEIRDMAPPNTLAKLRNQSLQR
ncbi:hypothetical protein ABW21_db0204811 [Orbilia brochopaga]|nr:hypothetical protein ABW21_db0204811 [Drechslerella brochopaga]